MEGPKNERERRAVMSEETATMIATTIALLYAMPMVVFISIALALSNIAASMRRISKHLHRMADESGFADAIVEDQARPLVEVEYPGMVYRYIRKKGLIE
jgi:hypothetical protein